jgi:DNA polymerase III subunit gamma/tau
MGQRLTGGKTIRSFLVGVGIVGLISSCSLAPSESPPIPSHLHALGSDIKREDVPKHALPAFDRAVAAEQQWQTAKRIADEARAKRDGAIQRQRKAQEIADGARQLAIEVQASQERRQQEAAVEIEREQRQAETDLLSLQKQRQQLEAQQRQQQDSARLEAELQKAQRNLEATQNKKLQNETSLTEEKKWPR